VYRRHRATDDREAAPTTRGQRRSTRPCGCVRGKTPEEESRTWLRGETNPRRSEAEQAVEGVRNAEDGTERAWVKARDPRRKTGSGRFRLMPRWGRRPQGRRSRVVASRGAKAGPRAGRARNSGGDAKRTAGSTARSHWPNGDGWNTAKATRKRQRPGGIGEPDTSDTSSHEDCEAQRIPRRGSQRGDTPAASQDRNPSKGNA